MGTCREVMFGKLWTREAHCVNMRYAAGWMQFVCMWVESSVGTLKKLWGCHGIG